MKNNNLNEGSKDEEFVEIKESGYRCGFSATVIGMILAVIVYWIMKFA